MAVQQGDKGLGIPQADGSYVFLPATRPAVGDRVIGYPLASGGYYAVPIATPAIGDTVVGVPYGGGYVSTIGGLRVPGMIVAVGSGPNTVAWSSDGVNWTGLGKPAAIAYNGMGICYNGSIWVAVGRGPYSGGSSIAWSSDGKTWNGLGNIIFNWDSGAYSVDWNGVMFVAAGKGRNCLAYSYNGVNWAGLGVPLGIDSAYGFSAVASSGKNGMWVAAGTGGVYSLWYSYNGIDWTHSPSFIFDYGNCVAYGGTMWVAGGYQYNGNTLAYSPDGINWIGLGDSIFSSCYDIASNGDRWVAVGTGDNSVAWSDDGIIWHGLGNPVSTNVGGSIVWDTLNGIWVMGGSGSTGDTLAWSPDGIAWHGLGANEFWAVFGIASKDTPYKGAYWNTH